MILIQTLFTLISFVETYNLCYYLTLKYTTNLTPRKKYINSSYRHTFIKMHRLVSTLTKTLAYHSLRNTQLVASMSGLKLRTNKKSSSTVFAELSSEYLQNYNEEKSKDQNNKQRKSNHKKNTLTKSKTQDQELMQIQQLKNSWLGNALQDDLLFQTKQWEGDTQTNPDSITGDKNQQNEKNKHNPQHQGTQQSKRLFSQHNSNMNVDLLPLKTKSFKKQITKTQLIANSRKFLEIICNIFPRHQVQRIIAELKQFCQKRDLNIPSLASLNIEDEKSMSMNKKSQQRKLEKQIKIIEKITKQREKKLFMGVRKIFDETLTDIQLIDNLLSLLSQSDPYIMNSQDIHKLIYNHVEGVFEDQASHHKAEINIILDKKQRQSLLTEKDQQKAIDELLSPKKEFLKEAQEILNPKNKKQRLDDESQQDLINVFEQFSMDKDANQSKTINKQPILSKEQTLQNKLHKQKQRHQKKREKSMKLIVKKNINQAQQKATVPQQFEINQHSLHQIQRILFKNKKIVEDNVVFKKVKSKNISQKIEKERQQFGKNWIYSYQMPYALDHSSCQQFIDFISKHYGQIIEYYIFPYKNMLEKRQNIMIHIENQKRIKAQEKQKTYGSQKQKNLVADKLLEKIQKQKNLKLNKSSMVFKFRSNDSKQGFLMPQMRLYGLNFKTFRNVRFQQAQSKKIIAISMIPWGCSSQDLMKAINKALKPIEVEVSYQSCILAKGFIFVEFDNFYECLNACQLLNNLPFQGHSLKVQINYGSSKIYGQKYKNALEFDHYETLVKKLKDIKCFYNQVYQD